MQVKITPVIVAIGVYGALTAAEEWLAQNIKRGNEDESFEPV